MPRLLLFNKPFGVLSQFTDLGSPTVRGTLSDYIAVKGVYPAGRLDRDSEGLFIVNPPYAFMQALPPLLEGLRAALAPEGHQGELRADWLGG